MRSIFDKFGKAQWFVLALSRIASGILVVLLPCYYLFSLEYVWEGFPVLAIVWAIVCLVGLLCFKDSLDGEEDSNVYSDVSGDSSILDYDDEDYGDCSRDK